jgi:hypothetical protein
MINSRIIIPESNRNDEILLITNSIQSLLTIAQYYQSREEMTEYLALIATCVFKVEELVKSCD